MIGLNLLDCVTDPARLIAETVRALAAGGGLPTPFDWSSHATPPDRWLDGLDAVRALLEDSLRGGGASAAEVKALKWMWAMRLHAGARINYESHLFCVHKPLLN